MCLILDDSGHLELLMGTLAENMKLNFVVDLFYLIERAIFTLIESVILDPPRLYIPIVHINAVVQLVKIGTSEVEKTNWSKWERLKLKRPIG